jgi:predicted TIM-barrel fold metal-dependent hydrolase
MLDSHVHIGQFEEEYYDYGRVFDVVFNSGAIDKIVYSSTSSCIAGVEYGYVRNEIEEALKKYPANVATPLFWYVPDYINQEISVEAAMGELGYGGFKLHPHGNEWDFENDARQCAILHEIFDYADRREMPVLIHTGENGVDRPNRFERFFGEYKNANVILAHCRPACEAAGMMRKYPNVSGDTAFAPKARIDEIKKAGFGDRLLFGSDFPITHYYYDRGGGLSLGERYRRDLEAVWG